MAKKKKAGRPPASRQRSSTSAPSRRGLKSRVRAGHLAAALPADDEWPRVALEHIRDHAIFSLDLAGRIASWPAGAERVFGFSATEAIGQEFALIFPPEQRQAERVARRLRRAHEAGSVVQDGWHRRKNGQNFWGTGTLVLLRGPDGTPRGYVKILRDKSEGQAIEEALRRAKTDAEAANAAKDHFLANISHELRTPLSATLLWAKLLKDYPADPERLREGLEAIEKSAKEQQALIEDLVDTSRIAAGKLRLQLQEISLGSLAHTALEIIRPSALEKEIALEDKIDERAGSATADPVRLQQVLVNLLNNAVKFTPSGGRVRLRLQRRGDRVEFQVSDNGRGIAAEFLPRLFERFTQADSSSASFGGLGLGLSIARQLTELHGGSIVAHSPGLAKGAVFTVRLPLPAIHRLQPENPEPDQPPSLANIRVLLVEDDTETSRALAATLRKAGATVTAVDSGPRALAHAARHSPDLILSDIGLGRMSGHELMIELRAREKKDGRTTVPAVALTAYADEKNRVQALRSGFQQVLTKPVEPIILLRSLAALHQGGQKPRPNKAGEK